MFPPEFLNRMDTVVVFRKMTLQELQAILELEVNILQERVLKSEKGGFVFHCTEEAKQFLLARGYSKKHGARPLKRAIEKYLGNPLRSLMTSGQVRSGDLIGVEYDPDAEELGFSKVTQGALVKTVDPVQSGSAVAKK